MKVITRRSCLGLITIVSKSFAGFVGTNRTGRTSKASRGVAYDLLDGSFTVIVQAVWSRQVSEGHVHFRIASFRKPAPAAPFSGAAGIERGIRVSAIFITSYTFCMATEGTKTSVSSIARVVWTSTVRRCLPFGVSTERVAAEMMARKMSQPILLQSK